MKNRQKNSQSILSFSGSKDPNQKRKHKAHAFEQTNEIAKYKKVNPAEILHFFCRVKVGNSVECSKRKTQVTAGH